MKHEIDITRPDYIIEDWPGKYDVFPWLEYVITVPNPIFIITTLKTGGIPNANLHSWGMLLGQGDECLSLLAILTHHHTYQNILNTHEWVLNYPSYERIQECSATIQVTEPDRDEISEAGFTVEQSLTVKTPRIAECLYNLECVYQWDRELFPNSPWHLFCGKVTHAAVDERLIAPDPEERMKQAQWMYNVRGTLNPLNGDFYGANTVGLINQVIRLTPETDENTRIREE
ncbi:MAG: flavin reductase [Anaerolineaceae bacterium]|nr:flavin reductase [Anaerolineaceae bacterium]